MDTLTISRDLVEDLYQVEGKAEIIHGEIVHFPMTGDMPTYAAEEIFVSLRAYVRRIKQGRAFADGNGFLVDLPHRQSFSPDAGYHVGPPAEMKFFQGAPIFAVEVRSENDYGPAAEHEMAAKRTDYFAAGTLVVWDVDLLHEPVIRVYRDGNADQPAAVFQRGQTAEAEPAVVGWSMPVDDLFAE